MVPTTGGWESNGGGLAALGVVGREGLAALQLGLDGFADELGHALLANEFAYPADVIPRQVGFLFNEIEFERRASHAALDIYPFFFCQSHRLTVPTY